MYGIQLHDLRADALPMFVIKHLGCSPLLAALLELGRRAAGPAPAFAGPRGYLDPSRPRPLRLWPRNRTPKGRYFTAAILGGWPHQFRKDTSQNPR